MNDNSKVSNELHELKQFAESLDVPLWKVLKAKTETGSNDREVLKDHLYRENTIKAITEQLEAMPYEKVMEVLTFVNGETK